MNWIRKTVLLLSLLMIAFFAVQADETSVQQIESQKTDTNFCKDIADSSAFIQPQGSYQFAASIRTDYPAVIKWFDSLFTAVPQYEAVKTAFNFANQPLPQSRKISLMLYAFHFFW